MLNRRFSLVCSLLIGLVLSACMPVAMAGDYVTGFAGANTPMVVGAVLFGSDTADTLAIKPKDTGWQPDNDEYRPGNDSKITKLETTDIGGGSSSASPGGGSGDIPAILAINSPSSYHAYSVASIGYAYQHEQIQVSR